MNQPRRSMLDQKKSSPNLSRSSCAAKQPSSLLTAFQQCAKLTTFLFSKKVKLLKQANTTNYSKSKVANTVVSTNSKLGCISKKTPPDLTLEAQHGKLGGLASKLLSIVIRGMGFERRKPHILKKFHL